MKISTCLIGEDSLLIQCGRILLKNGHNIVVVVTTVSKIQDWAKENNILWLAKIRDLFDHKFDFDYLFSIVNSYILSKEVIALARCAAINYHDSPLPKYAGLNATSWALIAGEKKHGVTWHLMDQRLDTGNIVAQQLFAIDSDETALSLNLKCYQKASELFEGLLSDIEQGKIPSYKQLSENRSYFARDHLLPYLGFIDFYSQTAEEILQIHRALSVGALPNAIGTLKLYLPKHYFIISKLALVEEPITFPQKPGILFYINNDILYVTTKTSAIKIIELVAPDTTVLSAKMLINKFGIGVGYQLPKPEGSNHPIAQMLYKSALRKEQESVANLVRLQEHAIFNSNEKLKSQWVTQSKLDLREMFSNTKKHSIILSAILIYLYRLNNYEDFFVFFVHSEFHAIQQQCAGLLSIFFPFFFKISDDFSLEQILTLINKNNFDNRPVYLTDLRARYPELNNKNIEPHIVVNFINAPLDLAQFPKETTLYIQVNTNTASIQMAYRQQHNPESATQALITHFNDHIKEIVLACVQNPTASIAGLAFLTKSERQTLLNWGRGTTYPLPNLSIIELFEKQVRQRPHQVAVMFEGRSITYYQLWIMSNKFAEYIYTLDCLNKNRVGIYLSRSVEMIAAILGILKTNSTYIPIDIHYPLERVHHIIQETDLHLVITQAVFLERLQGLMDNYRDSVVLVSEQAILNSTYDTFKNIALCKNSPAKLAYILFTSGTTGKPKGVMVTQKNVLNYCYWFLETTHFSASSIIDFSSSIGFDLSVPCTIAPLLVGGSIAMCTEQTKSNPEQYLAHLSNSRVTHVEITPGYLNLLLQYPAQIRALKDLNYLLIGADTLCKSDIVKWLELSPQHILINEYGPTETTVAVTSYFIQANQLANQPSIPIGSPGYNTQCYVLDKHQNLCPIGMPGELYIAGEQVTHGYLRQDDILSLQFVNIEEISKQKLYKSGDSVIWSPKGFLYFLGRTDRQVKIKGYRVELSEIEFILTNIPGIQQAAVVLSCTGKNTGNLTAYLVCNKQFKNDQIIRDYLLQHLPKFMVPKEFAIIAKLPMKENEKIDYVALEKINKVVLRSYDQKKYCSSVAETIKLIWKMAFNNIIDIHIGDNFFNLGGDSLTAIQIIDTLQDHYNIDIPLYTLFKYPTVTELEIEINRLLNKKKSKSKISNLKRQTLSMVPLAKGSSAYPLFLIHPVGGTVFWYYQMAALLQGKYTVYGIQDPNVDNHAIHFATLEEMAAYYLKDIKKIQPSSERYHIAGASFGASVAFEIANQLLQENKCVSFLGALDGWAYYPDSIMQTTTSTQLSKQPPAYLKIDQKRQEQLQILEVHRKKLLNNYTIPFLNLDLCVFKAKELWPLFQPIQNAYNGWSAHVGGEVRVCTVPGNHETMFFEPYVYELVNGVEHFLKLASLKN